MMPTVTRVVTVGNSLYMLLPRPIVCMLTLKAGDRLVVDTDGKQIYARYLPLEKMLKCKPYEPTKGNGVEKPAREPVTAR
jgi:antitoxin component of MazEF toxin-antitoxin module